MDTKGGGTWRNVEDEVLKAAVMKYGVNQWSRISSLLVGRSAKQCKARWTQWLDPNVCKSEWSSDDDKKLIHLAQILPNQWNTIAPSLGRTPDQCLDHYQYLLTVAQQQKDNNNHKTTSAKQEIVAAAVTQSSRLKKADIDYMAETRPAKPDAIDMPEHDKQMLSEVAARIKNATGRNPCCKRVLMMNFVSTTSVLSFRDSNLVFV